MGDSAWDRKTKQLVEPHHLVGLEAGLVRGQYDGSEEMQGRYGCRSCQQDLILRAVGPHSKQQPHFRHQNNQDCPAAASRRRQIERDDQVVFELRDQLVKAWPGASITLELPLAPGHSSPARELPPAIVVCGQQETVVIERLRALPATDQVRARVGAVRVQHGRGVRHVWFLAKDPLQFAHCGTLQVAPRGLMRTEHVTVAPSAQQLAIVEAGGGVYWLDGWQVFVPYGVHDFTHEARDGEDWAFPDWRRGWIRDWRISHPSPAPDATRWGLVPTSLHQLTASRATFDLTEVHDVMQRLEQVQRARWRHRRSEAQKLYTSRQASAETKGTLTLRATEGTPPGGTSRPKSISTPRAGASATSPVSVELLATGGSGAALTEPAAPTQSPIAVPPPPRTPPLPAFPPQDGRRRTGLRSALRRGLRRLR